MEAILLVGHGSRDPEGNEELLRFVEMVRGQAPQYVIEACFLEFAKPSILGGIENCVRQGATRVVLVPIILFAAGHAKLHIPDAIDHAKRKYPNVEFAYGRPFGVHQKVVNILRHRLAEAGYTAGVQAGSRDGDTAVLLLGRGSSDRDANSDFYKMARLFWEEVPVKWTESSFIGVTEPTFEEGLERCLQLGAKTVYILPYFLFTGILIKRIEGMVAEFAERHPDRKVVLADYFGFHPELAELLLERVDEAFAGRAAMNCDMCQYRLQAAAHMDHHHHHDDEHGHHHHGHDHHHGHNHGHDHDHHHGHEHGHDHDHHHGHDHEHHHGHDHHHGHENGHDHEHGHHNGHDHEHHHGHDHEHHHGHDHEHGREHGREHDHEHDHDHDHAHAHKHGH